MLDDPDQTHMRIILIVYKKNPEEKPNNDHAYVTLVSPTVLFGNIRQLVTLPPPYILLVLRIDMHDGNVLTFGLN